jgi:hypothetical protein
MSSEVSSPIGDAQLTPEEQLAANNKLIEANHARIREIKAERAEDNREYIETREAAHSRVIEHINAAIDALDAAK